jgi:hypothetical protein
LDLEKDWSYDNWVELQIWDEERSAILLVDVILFSDKKELLKAYDEFPDRELQQGMPSYDPPDIGEQIVGEKQDGLQGRYAINWTYLRCYSLVNIWARFGGNSPITEEGLSQYAAALDKRLNKSICPI